jgi:DNA-binding NtrC family response regulator
MMSAATFDSDEADTSLDAIVAEAIRVVVADDDDDIRRLVAVSLRHDGYEVLEAKDGIALLELLSHGKKAPHVVISDVRMPGVDGLTMLAALRGVGVRVPIILMSAHCDADVRDEARTRGADAFFDKPFDMDDLRMAVLNLQPRTRT